MFSNRKAGWLALSLGVALLLIEGAGANAADQAPAQPSPQAVTCTMCQVTWVKMPDRNQKGRVVGYHWGKKECADCMDAITSFINTGKFQRTCKACGGEMVMCEAREAPAK